MAGLDPAIFFSGDEDARVKRGQDEQECSETSNYG
jgi:hypothetical protein